MQSQEQLQQQIGSELLDRRQCVLVWDLAQRWQLPHDAAAQRLRQCVVDLQQQQQQADKKKKHSFHLTSCRVQETTLQRQQQDEEQQHVSCSHVSSHLQEVQGDDAIAETVFTLVTKASLDAILEPNQENCLVAVAHEPSLDDDEQDDETMTTNTMESVQTAHERYLASMRDALASYQTTPLVQAAGLSDAIGPSPMQQDQLQERLQAAVPQQHAAPNMGPASTSLLLRDAPPKQATTAASFFGKSKSTTTKTTAGTKKTTKSTTKTTSTKTTKSKKKKDDDDNDEDASVEPQQDEKENNAHKPAVGEVAGGKKTLTSKNKAIGNADDFVGDVEDSDDDDDDADDPMQVDLPEEDDDTMEPKGKKNKPTKKATREPLTIPDDDDDNAGMQDDDDDNALAVRGAMDAFAVTVEPKRNASSKRQRKTMETRTFSDAQGYLHTETVEVWKDISQEEEEEARKKEATKPKTTPRPAASAASKGNKAKKGPAKSSMKQGSLASFFGKKK